MARRGQLDLNALVVFVTVAEAGGFTAAAERLGVAKAKVSVEIRRLEEHLGATLFNRTTRHVTLTETGHALYGDCRPLLRGIEEAADRVGTGREELAGTLRLSTTVDHAVQSLAPALAQFAARHPGLQIDLRTSDRIVDLVAEGIDLAIRLGWLQDSTLRAVKLGEFDQYVVAAPDYLRRAGHIASPEDLARQDWLALTLLPAPLTWQFVQGDSVRTVQLRTRMRADSTAALRALLRHGAGISALDQFSAREDLESGRLVRVLDGWTLRRGGIYAVYPPGRHVPAKVNAFVRFYRESLS